jgi:Undecaprenyl-phosphate glucose phosphotransferase
MNSKHAAHHAMPLTQQFLARWLDPTLIVVGAVLAAQIRFAGFVSVVDNGESVALSLVFAWMVFPMCGIYQSWRGRSLLNLTGKMVLAWLWTQASTLVVMFALHRSGEISRLWFLYWGGITTVLLVSSRLVVNMALRKMREHGLNSRTVAVVGHGEHCRQVLLRIDTSPDSGFRAVAGYDVMPNDESADLHIPMFADYLEFVRYIRENDVRELWLALPLSEEKSILRFVNEFRDELLTVRFMPDVKTLALFENTSMTQLIGVPAINLMASPMTVGGRIQKGIFDRVFAFIVLLGLTPLLAVIAIAVKLSSPGPVFFRQKRKGADGRVFSIYKFRSMRQHKVEHGVVQQATRNDPRITKIGAFLRKTSLDELPQFINVLRGEMSVVGPRPHAIEHDDMYQKIVSGYIHRYRVKPGITGWAQINGYRGETDRLEKMQKRVEYDMDYLQNWNFLLDLRIIGSTVIKGFSGTQAY